MLILEIIFVALVAMAASRLLAAPWRGYFFNALKLYLTVRMVWLLLLWPISDGSGGVVPAWQLVLDQVAQIDAATFWTFAALGAAIRFAGVMASMARWQLILRGQDIEMPFRHVFGAFLIGRAIGFFLPSTAGLDAYKLYDAARFTGRTVEVTAGTVLEKVLGISGIFLTFLIALPFGVSIFGENAAAVAAITVPLSMGVIGALLVVLFYPALVQWVIERLPIPGKARLESVVLRISRAAAAYRDKKGLVGTMLLLSFAVHFTTAAMYFFMAIAVGAGAKAVFWPIVFGSSIQIFATVIGPTIGGLGVREAAQLLTVGSLIGAGAAIVSATLGFWIGEVPTLFGFLFWMVRGDDYRPAYCRVRGEQVDYEAAARAAVSLEEPGDPVEHEEELPSLAMRVVHSAGLGLGTGVLAGLLIGALEALVIRSGGFGGEAQVLWYGPLAYAVVLGGLGTAGGAVLGVLPMGKREAQGWTPSLGMIGTFVPFGLAITLFRLRRDVFLEQMPPLPVLLGVLVGFGALALVFFFAGRRIFQGPLGRLVQPGPAVVLMMVVVVGGAFWSRLELPPQALGADPAGISAELESHPNVVLIVIDTLRADALSCYGGPANAPNICGLAEDGRGTRFDGFSHASWTKPATASLLTSTLPTTHKAMSKVATLPSDLDHVAEAFSAHGYATGGVASNINLAESFGFDQGYDEYHYLGPDYLAGAEESGSKLILYQIVRSVWFKLAPGLRFGDFYQDSKVVNEVAGDFLDRHTDTRFFLFVHYMDPHDPYFEHPYDGTAIARVSNQHPDAELAAEMRRLYLGEIEYVDAQVGALLERLRAAGVLDRTVVALTSDHGEEFMDHGGWWHGLTLYDEQIRVPLLMKWADRGGSAAPGATEGIARHIDVAPTLLARAGIAAPDSMQGVDLARPELRAEKDRQHYSEEDHEGNVIWSLRTRDAKLIVSNPGNPRGLPERELFDVTDDPGESRNLHGADPEGLAASLEAHADAQRRFAEGAAVAGGGEVEMSLEECEQLRMLGYVEDCSGVAAN